MPQYFKSREEAGDLLAEKLMKYRYENNVVMALSPGGVIVGERIAQHLHCIMTMLLIEDVKLPGPQGATVGVLNQTGEFTHNNMYSTGQIDEFVTEYHNYLELEKMHRMHDINQLLGEYGIVDRKLLVGSNIIIVSDGFRSGTSLDAAMAFLKPVRTDKVVIVTPVASVKAIDRMHILGDEIQVLDVKANYVATSHYFEDNKLPPDDIIRDKITNVVHRWL